MTQLNWKEEMTGIDGFAPFEDVFSFRKLTGQVFAIELLAQPLSLYAARSGKKIIEIDRQNVTHAIYTNPAKKKLCEICFKAPEMKS